MYIKTGSVLVCIVLVSVLFAPAVSLGDEAGAPGGPAPQRLHALTEALEQNDELQEALAVPLPAQTVVDLLADSPPDAFEAAWSKTGVQQVADLLDPAWSDGPESVRALMLDRFDPGSGRFVFDSGFAVVEGLVARVLLAHLGALQLDSLVGRDLNEGLLDLVESGEVPDSWRITDVQADAAAEETGQPGPQGPAEAEWEEAPEDPETHPYAHLVGEEDEPVRVLETENDRLIYLLTGGAGCDLCGVSMGAFNSPLTATFDLGDLPAEGVTEAELHVRTFDVDWFVASPCGTPVEKDEVYLNGNPVGHLTGENEKWSVTPLTLNPDWFVDGVNEIKLYVDTLGNGCWRATTSWIQVALNGATGDVEIVDLTTDKDGYNLGDTIQATATLRTDADEPDPYPATIQFNLHNPDGDIPSQGEFGVSLPQGEEVDVDFDLLIPEDFEVGTAEVGRWTVVATAFDKDAIISDREDKEVGVGTDVAITEEDVELDLVDSNPDSGSLTVDVSGEFSYSSALEEAQDFTLSVHALRDGEVYHSEDREYTIPPNDSGTMSLEAVRLQLDAADDPAVRVVLDSGGDLVEVNEDNNEVEVEVAKPEITEFRPNVWGNYVAEMGISRQAFFATTQDPAVGGEVEGVRFQVETAGGSVVAGPVEVTQTSGADTYKWDYDTGELEKGQYVATAVAFTDSGTESDPETYEFWTFGPPWMLSFLDTNFPSPLWDPFNPRYTSASSGEGFAAKYSGTLGVSFEMDVGADPAAVLLNAMFDVLGPPLCLSSPEIKAGFSLTFEHDVNSEESTWSAKISVGRSRGGGHLPDAFMSILGKKVSLGVSGEGTWDFQDDGEWLIKTVEFEGSLGVAFDCNATQAILAWLKVPPPIAKWITSHFLELKLTLSLDGNLKVVLDRDVDLVFGKVPIERLTVGPQGGLSMTGRAGPKLLNANAEFTGSAGFDIGWRSRVGWGIEGGLCPDPCGVTFTAQSKAEPRIPWTGIKVTVWDVEQEIWSWTGPDPPDAWWWGGNSQSGPTQQEHRVDRLLSGEGADPVVLPAESFLGGTDDILLDNGAVGRTTVTLDVAPDGSALALFDRDDPDLTQAVMTGIPSIGAAARSNGEWIDQEVLFQGDRFEAIPRVAVAPTGHAVAAWERFADVIADGEEPDFDTLRVVYALRDDDGVWSEPRVLDPGPVGRQHVADVGITPDGSVAVVAWDQYEPGGLASVESSPTVASIVDSQPQDPLPLAPAAAQTGLPALALTPTGQIMVAYNELDEDLQSRLMLDVVDARTGSALPEPVLLASGPGLARSPALALGPAGVTAGWVETLNGTAMIKQRTLVSSPDAALPDLGELPGLPEAPGPGDLVVGPQRVVVPADPEDPATIEDLRVVPDDSGLVVFVWNDLERGSVRSLTHAPDGVLSGPPGAEDVLAGLDKGDRVAADLPSPESPETGLVAGRAIVDLVTGPVRSLDAAYDAQGDSVLVLAARHEMAHGDGEPMQIVTAERHLGADLAVMDVVTDPANPAPGSHANVSVVVRNVGERPASGATLALTANEAVIGTGVVAPLAAGEEARVEVPWQVPDMPRSNELTARLHFDGVTGDADASNDAGSRTVTVPDLVITDVSSRNEGSVVRLFATVENQGVLGSEATSVTFSGPGGTHLGSAALSGLGPAETGVAQLFVASSVFDEGTNEVRAGLESAEPQDPTSSDGSAVELVDVLPDPALGDVRVVSAVEGQPAVLRAVVENAGGLSSGPVRLVAYEGDSVVADVGVPGLSAGQRHAMDFPVDVTEGKRSLRIALDPGFDEPDLSRSNNIRHLVVASQPEALPELSEASLQWVPEGALVTLHNRGPGLLTGETFALYLGEARDPDPFGPTYATKVENQFAVGQIGGIAGHERGSTLLPEEQIVIQIARPDEPNRQIRLADLAADETVSLRLDPSGTALEDAGPDMLLGKSLVSIASSTHPDPGRSGGDSAEFAFAVAPGHAASGYSVVLDGSPGTVPDTSVDTTTPGWSAVSLTPGTHYLHVRARLSTGEWTATDHYPVQVAGADDTPPETRLRVGSPSVRAGDDGFIVSTSTPLSLRATDDASGVAAVRYRFDDGPVQTAAGGLTAPAGEHVLTYWSEDQAGNEETPRSTLLTVETGADTWPPVTTHAVDPPATIAPDETLFVAPGSQMTLSATDPWQHAVVPPSGVEETLYALDGGDPVPYAGPFSLPATGGAHTLEYWSVDEAGNAGAAALFSLHVDDVPPSVAIQDPQGDDVVVAAVTFAVEALDDGAGVDRVELHHEGEIVAQTNESGEPGVYELSVDTSQWPLGNNRVTALAVDRVGNAASDEVWVYVISRSVHLEPDPEANLDRIVPRPLQDALGGVP